MELWGIREVENVDTSRFLRDALVLLLGPIPRNRESEKNPSRFKKIWGQNTAVMQKAGETLPSHVSDGPKEASESYIYGPTMEGEEKWFLMSAQQPERPPKLGNLKPSHEGCFFPALEQTCDTNIWMTHGPQTEERQEEHTRWIEVARR